MAAYGRCGHDRRRGYMKITDRTKDLIKSGGSGSVRLTRENALVGHPAIKGQPWCDSAPQMAGTSAGLRGAERRSAGVQRRTANIPWRPFCQVATAGWFCLSRGITAYLYREVAEVEVTRAIQQFQLGKQWLTGSPAQIQAEKHWFHIELHLGGQLRPTGEWQPRTSSLSRLSC